MKTMRRSLATYLVLIALTPSLWASSLSFTGTGCDGKPCTLSIELDTSNKISSISLTGFEKNAVDASGNASQPRTIQWAASENVPASQSSDENQTNLSSNADIGDGLHAVTEFNIDGNIQSNSLASIEAKEIAKALIVPIKNDSIDCSNLSR